MIRSLESIPEETLAELLTFCEKTVFGVKAVGPVLSYGLQYPFVSAWAQRDETGQLTAFFSKYYGTLTVAADPKSNEEELTAFLPVVGYRALFGPEKFLRAAGASAETGCVMALEKGDACIAKRNTGEEVSLVWDEDFRDFYEVLEQSNPGYLSGTYEDFLPDFSHRVRHRTARSILLKVHGRPAATAAALVVTEHTVFLGGVATLPEDRGKHYASTCLRALCDCYADRRVFLCCRPDKQAFYEGLGFQKIDDYLEYDSSRK